MGEVKGCTCINGTLQQEYIRKEDEALPTVVKNSVLMTVAVDAYQGQVIAFIDLTDAFVHMLTDEKITMTLQGELCKLL